MEQPHEGVVIDVVFKKKRVYPKCEHGKFKNVCKTCSPHRFCLHGRRVGLCKLHEDEIKNHVVVDVVFKKKYIPPKCEHGQLKSNCMHCSPNSFCSHNKRIYMCKHCGGGGLCVHQRQKHGCIECMGGGICKHKKRRSDCIDCGGSNLCIHQRHRRTCVECAGFSICQHGRRKTTCKKCPKCYVHLCERRVAKSTGRTTAYQWQETEKPETGTEIYNDRLASALLEKFEFNQAELEIFDQEFFYNTYIKGFANIFKLAMFTFWINPLLFDVLGAYMCKSVEFIE